MPLEGTAEAERVTARERYIGYYRKLFETGHGIATGYTYTLQLCLTDTLQ